MTGGGGTGKRRSEDGGVVAVPKILVIDKARAVLDLLAENGVEAGPSEVARQLRWNKSTTYRLLSAMEDAGLVARSAGGRYSLGLRLMELGAVVRDRLDLGRIADPVLAELAVASGQSTFLLVRHRFVATCIQRIPGPHVAVLHLRLGGTQSLHLGGGPRALLAGLSPKLLEGFLSRSPFPPITRDTLTEAAQLRADVETTRSRAYALSLEDVTPGVAALGAPIIDSAGAIEAAISVAGLRQDYEGEGAARLASMTMAAAERISRALGWTGPLTYP